MMHFLLGKHKEHLNPTQDMGRDYLKLPRQCHDFGFERYLIWSRLFASKTPKQLVGYIHNELDWFSRGSK